jgi:hypothetical protein
MQQSPTHGITWRVSLVAQELFTYPEHLSLPPVFSWVHVTPSLVLCVCFVDLCLSFCTFFLLAIVLSVLRYTDSDYPYGIFKLFFWLKEEMNYYKDTRKYLHLTDRIKQYHFRLHAL